MTTEDDKIEQFEGLKQDILENYPRLNKDDSFTFACHKDLECFGNCCRDVNIFLTPYDILRLKNRLKISSEEFVARHAVSPPVQQTRIPIIALKMRDDEEMRCPFVGDDGGCTVYEDRPTSCRMYPVGQASGKTENKPEGTEFFFLMQDEKCCGLQEKKEWTIEKWMADQDVELYDSMNNEFKEINLNPFFQQNELPAEKIQMYYMAMYNLDMFRRFLYDSRFFQVFEIEKELIEKMKTDDLLLLTFAFRWLRFSLFGEKTLEIPPDVLEKHTRKMFKRAAAKNMPK